MDIKKLQTFLVVAEELNYSRAAIKLNYSQPTVSKHIQSLEEDLNVMLLNRKEGQYQLTEAGVKLYNHSLNIKKEVNEISKISFLSKDSYQLTLQGHDYYCYKYFIPAISKMRWTYPGISFKLNASNNQETVNKLLKNSIDIGIISGSVLPKSFKSVQIGHEAIGICVGKDIYQSDLTTEDYIQKYPLLIDESDFYQSANTFPYLSHSINVIDTNSDEVVHEAVLNRQCVGVLRLGRLEKEIENGDIIVIETVVSKDPVYLVTNQENMNQAPINTLYDILVSLNVPRNQYKFYSY
ncbi:LysR family transcriptional regulator [Aerococcaceae bacterium DSM 111020]|nr:LysR family transcriptional regulator [Aerococcaceae bacterium DSM 111020]